MIAQILGVLMTLSPTTGMSMVWHDEFDYWKPTWSTRQTAYTDDQPCARADVSCARVSDGQMILSVRKDPDSPGKYLTGHVGAKHEFSAYGYYEAKVEFPSIPGVLCGWWLAPTEDYIVGQSEIDIVENGLGGRVNSTIWYRIEGMGAGEFVEPPPRITTDLGPASTLAAKRRYGVLWTPLGYTFYIDGVPTGTLTEGLSDRPKFSVLSVKIPKYLQDDFLPERIRDYKMRIYWIRAWKLLNP